MYKFVLIGCTGTGKSTTMRACMSELQRRGYATNLLSTDELGESLFKNNSDILKKVLKFEDIILPTEVFQSKDPLKELIKHVGADLFRKLELNFINYLLHESGDNNTVWFDLGGKASSDAGIHDSLLKHKIIPIFLYAEHDTTIRHLEANEEWKKRASYRVHGKDKWKGYALKRRNEAFHSYVDLANIIITIDYPKLLTTKGIVKEIFYRLREMEISCNERKNSYTNLIKLSHFKPQEEDKGADKGVKPPFLTSFKNRV